MLSVVIPSRHEPASNIFDTARGLRDAVPDVRIVAVNDDGEPHGFGLAVRRGLDRCADGYVVICMADGSDDPAVLGDMIKELSYGYDMVVGSRYMKGGKQIGGPLVKRILSHWCGRILYEFGLPVHDATNAYRMIRASRLKELNLESTGFDLNLEITAKAYRAGWRICEVPVTWRDRRGGRSKFKLWKELPSYGYWFMYALGWVG
jgi:dolichol-phosphate mannosyltransferase